MKTLRIGLLVLLAVLLPFRAAVAAAMLCPPAKGNAPDMAMVAWAGTGHHLKDAGGTAWHDPADPHMHHAEMHHAERASADEASGHHDGFDKCNLCCDLCSMTPLISTLPSIPAPPYLSSLSFPGLSASAPSFLSDGQERPPRSC